MWQPVGSDIVTGKKWYTYHANRPHHAKVPANDARSLEAYQLYQAAARKRPRGFACSERQHRERRDRVRALIHREAAQLRRARAP